MEISKDIFGTIGPFVSAGFSLHWLHEKQKRPIGAEWQKVPFATIDDLRRTYAAGNNLGVRLGEPSLTACGYLHVIDLDIRIADLADEAWAALRTLFPLADLSSFPTVASGSGGASRHLYFISEKPFYGKKLAVSEGKHRRQDKARAKEVWSYDWEIELFGTGKQVAMPPSIHPDTGKPYVWEREFDFDLLELGIGPTIPGSEIEAIGAAEAITYEFETREPLTFEPGQLERDLAALPVSRVDDYHDWVMLGQALHHQFGGSDEGYQLWLAQSKRSTKFDGKGLLRKWRGFGKSRRQPVTMATVRKWAQEAHQEALMEMFEEEIESAENRLADSVPSPKGTDELDDLLGGSEPDDLDDLLGGSADAASDEDGDDDFTSTTETLAAGDPADPANWVSLLGLNEEGSIKPTLHNVRLILQNDPRTKGVMAYNEFTQEVVQRGIPGKKSARKKAAKPTIQLDGMSWQVRDKVNGDFWTEDKDAAIRAAIEAPKSQGGYEIKVPDRDLRDAVNIVGRKCAFHPVREYLEGLEWDGTERVERLFLDYLGAPDDAYHRNIARLMMVAAVTRVREPGHKYDFAVILEGLQGKRKSTFINILAKSWFVELDGDFEDQKQMVELMQGAWILEIPELSGFAKADVRHIKAFISRREDKVRLAYARRAQEYPRQCIFIGSTNDETYLKDETGGRRFWPVRCNVDEINGEELEQNIDQLWAEALTLYKAMRAKKPRGTLPLYLSDADARVIAERLQESRRVETTDDVVAGQIAEWLDRPINDGGFEEDSSTPSYRNETCLVQIWCECLGRDLTQYVGTWPATLGRAMRQVPDWVIAGSHRRFGRYGKQRAFIRTKARV